MGKRTAEIVALAGALLALGAFACASPTPTAATPTAATPSASSHRPTVDPLPAAEPSSAWDPLPLMGEDGRNEATTISAGRFHTCAIRLNTTPMCWGANQYKQKSTLENSGVVAITAGGAHTCMLYSDNSLSCNGSYFHFPGANRAPAHADFWPLPGDPRPLEVNPPLDNERFLAVSSGIAHACALPIGKSVVSSKGFLRSTPTKDAVGPLQAREPDRTNHLPPIILRLSPPTAELLISVPNTKQGYLD